MPFMKSPQDCRYNFARVKAGKAIEVQEQDVAALELEGWKRADPKPKQPAPRRTAKPSTAKG